MPIRACVDNNFVCKNDKRFGQILRRFFSLISRKDLKALIRSKEVEDLSVIERYICLLGQYWPLAVYFRFFSIQEQTGSVSISTTQIDESVEIKI